MTVDTSKAEYKEYNVLIKSTKEKINSEFNQTKSKISKKRVVTIETLMNSLKSLENEIGQDDNDSIRINEILSKNDSKRRRLDEFDYFLVNSNKELCEIEKLDTISIIDEALKDFVHEVIIIYYYTILY